MAWGMSALLTILCDWALPLPSFCFFWEPKGSSRAGGAWLEACFCFEQVGDLPFLFTAEILFRAMVEEHVVRSNSAITASLMAWKLTFVSWQVDCRYTIPTESHFGGRVFRGNIPCMGSLILMLGIQTMCSATGFQPVDSDPL